MWGGDEGCEHVWGEEPIIKSTPHTGLKAAAEKATGRTHGERNKGDDGDYAFTASQGQFCQLCDCWRGSLGLEPTPELYIAHMVEVFGEVKRVLRSDGVMFINMGDSYASIGRSGRKESPGVGAKQAMAPIPRTLKWKAGGGSNFTWGIPCFGSELKPKDLCGMPWRLAFALQADGWWLRSEIIWHKPNPMPESVRDRPTKAHETVFLLTKAARYFYDADAIRERPTGSYSAAKMLTWDQRVAQGHYSATDEWQRPDKPSRKGTGESFQMPPNPAGRNRRTVWTIPTSPFPGAHFACVSDDTECLTIDGWKRHEELRQGQLLAAYNLESGKLRWEPLNAVAVYDYAGEMIKVGGQSLGVLCTPNHRCITKTAAGHVRIRRADALTNNLKVPCAADWEQGTYGFSDDPHPIIAELLGWTVTDGHFNGSSTVITQSLTANGPKVERIEELLILAGFHYKKYTRHRSGGSFPNGTMVRECDIVHFSITKAGDRILKGYLSLAKRIPPSAVLWSIESIRALFAGIVGGDGNIRKDGRIQIVQKDKEFIDWTQILALRLGYRAIVSKRKRGWCVFLVKRKWLGLRTSKGSNVTRVPYDGKVWCPSLPSGTFVARRNGRVWITGNTFPPKLIEPMILTSPTKVCAVCGKGWERVTEKVGEYTTQWGSNVNLEKQASYPGNLANTNQHRKPKMMININETLGFRPGCDCLFPAWVPTPRQDKDETDAAYAVRIIPVLEEQCQLMAIYESAEPEDTAPAVVIDIFLGSGTSVMVALRHGRNAIGLELSEAYAEMARKRIVDDNPLWNSNRLEL